jgi:acyl-CoA thioester hydrolase
VSRVSSAELVPTFTTAVNTWQCDENDHLNVQYYTEFGHEASAHLLTNSGSDRAHRRRGPRARRARRSHPLPARVPDHRSGRGALGAGRGRRAITLYHESAQPGRRTVASTVRRRIASDRPWPRPSARAPKRRWSRCRQGAAAQRRHDRPADLTLADARQVGLIDIGRTVVKPGECDERGEFLPRHQFGRYSDGAPFLWNHLGFDRAAMQERQEGSVVVEMLNHYRGRCAPGT